MANLETMLDPMKQEKITEMKEERDHFSTKPKEEDFFPVKPSSSLTDENEILEMAIACREPDMPKNGYGVIDSAKQIMLREEDGISTFLKLKAFFEMVQKQHPESRLELQKCDGNWRVWCGACKKLLRPDKSGKAIHNIQRQHFTSTRHKKKLHLMLQAEEEDAERRRTGAVIKGSSATHDDKPGDGKDKPKRKKKKVATSESKG